MSEHNELQMNPLLKTLSEQAVTDTKRSNDIFDRNWLVSGYDFGHIRLT